MNEAHTLKSVAAMRELVIAEMLKEMRNRGLAASEADLNPMGIEARLQTYIQAGLMPDAWADVAHEL